MRSLQRKENLRACVIIAGMIAGVTILASIGRAAGINNDSMIMLYLLGVLFSSVLTRRYMYGAISAIAFALTFNYFFTVPQYSFRMFSVSDMILLFFFLATAICGSAIMSLLTRQMLKASRNEETARMMYEITSKFVHITGKKSIIMNGIAYIQEHSDCVARVRISGDSERYEGRWATDGQNMTYEYAIPGTSGAIGSLDITRDCEMEPKDEQLYTAVAAQIGAAIEREYLYNEREKIRVTMEREKNRSTFLRAVAHDIRTPLTSLTGASTLLAEQFDMLSGDEKRKLASDISDETAWLSNLVENILNMTRIDEGKLDIRRDYEVIDDVVAEAAKRMERLWDGRVLHVDYPDDVVALRIDGKLIAQVLINLFENAVRHTKPGDEISLMISIDGQNAIFAVSNPGKNIPNELKQKIFDAFTKEESLTPDSRRGVGLGLSICRAVVEAHGGEIWVKDNEPNGATVVFSLPMEE